MFTKKDIPEIMIEPKPVAAIILDNMKLDYATLRPLNYKVADDVRFEAILHMVKEEMFDPTDPAQAERMRQYALAVVFEAGRVQGIREERARRSAGK